MSDQTQPNDGTRVPDAAPAPDGDAGADQPTIFDAPDPAPSASTAAAPGRPSVRGTATGSFASQVRHWLDASWKDLMLRGVLGVVFGILAMAWPVKTVLALVLLWGAWALVDGVAAILQATHSDTVTARFLAVLAGILAIGAGVLALFRPGLTAVTLVWLLGLWLIARGVVSLVVALAAARGNARWLVLLTAAIDVLLGAVLVANPGRSALGIAVFIGVLAMVWGATFIALALTVRRTARAV